MVNAAWSGLDSMSGMDDTNYQQWKTLLEARTGMILPDERRSFLTTSLGIRMREIGFTDCQAYYDYVVSGRESVMEWAVLVDRLTVHETRFFRHMAAIDMLRELILPEWMSQDEPPKTIQCWSVGCATGEEPYSLAMLLDHFQETDYCKYYFGITASDISLAALATGRKGVYHSRKLRDVDAVLRKKYFNRVSDTHFEVNEDLRKRVCFAQLNVLEMEHAPVGKVHLIFCQNMLIYFDRKRRIEILNSLVQHLHPGGVLILGAGEILGWQLPSLEKIEFNDTLAFRRLTSM
ncbi:CheR family methyltransferase [Sulfuriflexus mobilis]|uniref:CheR family methyltransferase n=1 Tax=Sulfuriflexus mobilis TaxID=1811807 RepID=UPI0018D50985|nr:CheR family methyltransferase [Sulfuriflexus mobilis]